MPQQVRRREPGWDQFGHHWEDAGQAIEVSDQQASLLLGEPALPMYSLVTPGATVEAGVHDSAVGEGDPAAADVNSPAGESERIAATGSTPGDPRLKTPVDGHSDNAEPKAGKADTLDVPREQAASVDAESAPRGVKPDVAAEGGPHALDKDTGEQGRNVVGRSSRSK